MLSSSRAISLILISCSVYGLMESLSPTEEHGQCGSVVTVHVRNNKSYQACLSYPVEPSGGVVGLIQ